MTKVNLTPTTGDDAEIQSLIDAINKAALRLNELTAGEIDSVSGTDGHMFLLPHAQEQLRMVMSIRQAAILNALPANIALLDPKGLIISVNEGWRNFAADNHFKGIINCIGLNYLETCDAAIAKESSDATQVSEGIRSVLNGTSSSYMIEYPCHSPTQRRWFLMTVTPLASDSLGGAVIMHLDITHRIQVEEILRYLALAMDRTTDAIYLVDRDTMKFVHVNNAACILNGKQSDELTATPPWEVHTTTRAELELLYDNLITSGVPANPIDLLRKRADGSEFWVELRQQAEFSDGRWNIIVSERDISERMAAAIELQHMANYDLLTGLPNRKLFYEALTYSLAVSTISKSIVCVLFIDLDHFKNINDTLGHAIGDELLVQFSNRLLKCVRIRDTVGRLGGDEFAIIQMMEKEPNNSTIVANKIRAMLRIPFNLKGYEMTVTASIGITTFPDDASDTETLIKYADTAMYRAKKAGRDTYRYFTQQMNIEVLDRLNLENALQKALVKGEFILYYQPKVNLKTGLISGVEALIRWLRPGVGLVSPAEFIPVLEETGLIVDVGRWVIKEGCKQIGLWLNSAVGPLQVAVNVSSRQFLEGNLQEDIIKAINDNNIPPNLLELELTEGTLMANTSHTIDILQKLKGEGVHISIDDFGTGYSSLAYLRRFPIDKLKIDIAFVRNVTINLDDAAIVQTIIQMAHSLNLEVVAEGVETVEQLEFLKLKGADHIQGYYFSRPLPVDQMEQMILRQARLSILDVK